MRLTNTRAILSATAGALAIALATYYWFGHTPEGAGVAARNTARYSGLVFALAWVMRSRQAGAVALTYAFVAAHLIHFGTVLDLGWVDPANRLHHLDPKAVAVLGSGVLLILLIGITNGGTEVRSWRARMHTFLFYVAALLFLVASGAHAMKYWASAPTFLALLAALGYQACVVFRWREKPAGKGNL